MLFKAQQICVKFYLKNRSFLIIPKAKNLVLLHKYIFCTTKD